MKPRPPKREDVPVMLNRMLAASLMAALFLSAPALTAAQEEPALSAVEAGAPLFRMNGKEYDAKALKELAELLRPRMYQRMSAERVAALRGDALANYLTEVQYIRGAAAKAREMGITLPERTTATIEGRTRSQCRRLIYERDILPKIGTMSEEEIQNFYNTNLETLYSVEEQITFRTVFLSTYKPYTVQEGDTLRSIAKAISGSEDAFAAILSEETKRPRIEFLDPPASPEDLAKATLTPLPEGAEPVPPRALTVGEELMVPMNPAEIAEVEARAAKVNERLAAGEPFDKVARDFSQNERPGQAITYRPGKDRPILKELEAALRKLEVRKASEPIRTRHGFHIVYLERYQPAGNRTLDEVRIDITGRHLRERQAEEWNNWFLAEIAKRADRFHIDMAKLALPKDQAKEDDVIITLGDKTVNRADFELGLTRVPGWTQGMDLAALPKAELDRMLASHGPVRNLVFDEVIAERKLMEEPSIIDFRTALEDEQLANEYLMKVAGERAGTPTDEEVAAHYQENHKLWLERASVDAVRIYLPLLETDEAAKAKEIEAHKATLEAVKASAKDIDAFSKASAEIGRGIESTSPRAGQRPGTVKGTLLETLPAPVAEALKAAGPGKIAGPVELDNGVALFWVEALKEERQPPIDEVRDGVARHCREMRVQKEVTALREELTKTPAFELLDAGKQ
jgi:parvulin-like peptidyl-prolyl isomerase